jgi:DNA polymerase-1
MDDIVEEAKSKGYIDTLFGRRRYIPELKSNNYMVRKFGERVAMNTPIQGTAADIMKIAMINVYKRLKEEGLESKIVLQIHDELLVEAPIEEKEKVKEILVKEMENVYEFSVPLKVEAEEGKNWLAAK